MVLESSVALLSQGSLRDKVRLVNKEDSERYEIARIEDKLTFENGLSAVIRACKLLSEKNDGIILVGLAGPSGAGKSVLCEKLLKVWPSIGIINMESYTDATRVIDGDFDDKRLADYDTLLENIHGLRDGKPVQVPVYDFKSSSRTGCRTLEVPSSRIVILEGIYALSEKLLHFLDLGVSVTGGVPFNLVKRVLGDIPPRAGQYPKDTVRRIFDTVYPTYEALIEPDLERAHIKIHNTLEPFSGFNPTYTLKSTKAVTPEQMKAVLSEDFKERTEETRDIYLLPPGEDPEACRSFLRLRNRDGKYYLTFEEWVTDGAFVISPGITFEVNVRMLGGLMTLGYTVATILKRKTHIFDDDKVTVKSDCFEQQLNRTYVQVQGRDCSLVKNVADQLGLEASSYVPHTYIEQMQLEKLVNKVTDLPDVLKTKISSIPSAGSRVSSNVISRQSESQSGMVIPLEKRTLLTPRAKVEKARRFFSIIFKELLSDVHAKRTTRIDHDVRMILKSQGMCLNQDFMIGAVPGIHDGDKFNYKAEMNIVGLHFGMMTGIDFMKTGEGSTLATSIVASDESHYNNIFKSDEVIYCGVGNSLDDKGNKALVSSMNARSAVRVIRGYGYGNGKQIFEYLGLYRVRKYREEIGGKGNLLFKFYLVPFKE